jgi:hypothetical protein
LPGQADDRVVAGMVGGQLVEGAADRLVGLGAADQLGRGGAQLGADPVEALTGAGQHLGGGQLGVEGVPQPRLPQRAAQAWITAGPGGVELGAQPAVELVQRGQRRRRGRLDRRAHAGLGLEQAGDLVADQGRGAGELADRRLGVDTRHIAQHGPGGGQRVGDRGEPAAQTGQPLLGRRELAGDQRVQQRTGVVLKRVPLVFPYVGKLEKPALDDGRQNRVVGLIFGTEGLGIDAGERVGRVAEHGHPLGHRAGREIGQAVVEAMVTRVGGQAWITAQNGVDNALGERHELRHAVEPYSAGPTISCSALRTRAA